MAQYTPEPVDSIDADMQEAFNKMPFKPESREQALAMTKLEEAMMWYRKHHYKNGKKGRGSRNKGY